MSKGSRSQKEADKARAALEIVHQELDVLKKVGCVGRENLQLA